MTSMQTLTYAQARREIKTGDMVGIQTGTRPDTHQWMHRLA